MSHAARGSEMDNPLTVILPAKLTPAGEELTGDGDNRKVTKIPTHTGHIFANAQGAFPAKLND